MGVLGNLLTGFIGGEAALVVNHLIEQHGGVQGIVSKLEQSGLGAQAKSWLGTGANQPVTASQIHQAFGPDTINALAQKFGVPADQIAKKLSEVLPQAIDKLSPNGQITPH